MLNELAQRDMHQEKNSHTDIKMIEESKEPLKYLSEEETSKVSGTGYASAIVSGVTKFAQKHGKTTLDAASGVSMALSVPSMVSQFQKPSTPPSVQNSVQNPVSMR